MTRICWQAPLKDAEQTEQGEAEADEESKPAEGEEAPAAEKMDEAKEAPEGATDETVRPEAKRTPEAEAETKTPPKRSKRNAK